MDYIIKFGNNETISCVDKSIDEAIKIAQWCCMDELETSKYKTMSWYIDDADGTHYGMVTKYGDEGFALRKNYVKRQDND